MHIKNKIFGFFKVVSATQAQIAKLNTAQGFVSDLLSQYVKKLVSTLPEELNVVYLCNNGIEANDLALLLAREYTGNKDVLAFEGAYHGYLSALLDISPKLTINGAKDYVHVIPLPDMYRWPYSPKQYKVGINSENILNPKSVKVNPYYTGVG